MPSLIFMVLYIAAFAVGLGPVFWAIIGEIFPGPARASGSSASTAVNWGSNFVVSLVFLPIANAIGQGETFWIFAAISLAGLAFVSRFVPETKGREFGEVDADLLRRFGRRPRRAPLDEAEPVVAPGRLKAGLAAGAGGAWPVAQQTAAATIAWIIAKSFGPHGDPFFAPIAAVVALNTARGRRGVNTVQLLVGVVLGIGVGELVLLALGGGYGTLALAVCCSMLLARAAVDSPLVVAQAAASAILTVTSAGGVATRSGWWTRCSAPASRSCSPSCCSPRNRSRCCAAPRPRPWRAWRTASTSSWWPCARTTTGSARRR